MMHKIYLGHLSEDDPLHGYLQNDIQPQVTGVSGSSTYRVFRLNGSNDVTSMKTALPEQNSLANFFFPQDEEM